MIKTLIRIFRAGQETVMFVPMLAVLFIGCRMRALQLTRSAVWHMNNSIPTDAYFYLELQWVFRAVPVRSFEIDPLALFVRCSMEL